MRLMAPGRLLLWLALCLAFSQGCELSSQDREPIITLHDTLYVQGASLAEGAVNVALNQPITVTFNQYLDTDTFAYHNAFSLNSGGIWANGYARYRMTDRSLTFFPIRDMRPELIYTLSVNADTVTALGGVPLTSPFSLHFQTAASGTIDQHRLQSALSFVSDIEPIVTRSCDCHALDDSLVPISRDALCGVEAEGYQGRLLVVPFDPPHSYLMHKLLWDYPDRLLSGMPPAWDARSPLEVSQIGQIETWIVTGARP
jgi:hypothetical protein